MGLFEAGALRQHRRAAKDDDEPEAHPLHWLDPTVRQPEPDELPQSGGDSDAGGCKKAARDHIDDQKQDCRQEVAEQLPEGLFHRCLPFIGYPAEVRLRLRPSGQVRSDAPLDYCHLDPLRADIPALYGK